MSQNRKLARRATLLYGVLSAYINGKQVITIADSLNTSPSVIGLLVERQNTAPSVLVEFSYFELDEAG